MPVAGGGHRLYVNGGMRSRAGVGVGDLVRLTVHPASPEVPPPGDVASRLRRVRGARAAFEALSPSHRRELLRHIDDARTRKNRVRRILQVAHQVAGRSPAFPSGGAASRAAKSKPLWTCPKCGNKFVNRNQYHSCHRYSLEDVFGDRPSFIGRLFDRFREIVEACGPVTMLAYRDRIGFMVRVRFAGAVPKQKWLDVGFWLPRRLDDPRFQRIETITPTVHVHRLRITRLEDLDEDVAAWIREAYAVGCQEHLG